ncbi:MAG TPA: hypothetical protein VGE78_09220, partial [Agromyces sp.]
MNSIISGDATVDGVRPVVGGRVLSVGDDGAVLVDGRRAAAGDGLARALARAVAGPEIGEDASERPITV